MIKQAYIPSTGDIIWLNFGLRKGHEQSGRRPALVLSSKTTHQKTGMALVCPITSKVKGYSFEIPFTLTKVSGSILILQTTSADLEARQAAFIEKAPIQLLHHVRVAVGVLIGIE